MLRAAPMRKVLSEVLERSARAHYTVQGYQLQIMLRSAMKDPKIHMLNEH